MTDQYIQLKLVSGEEIYAKFISEDNDFYFLQGVLSLEAVFSQESFSYNYTMKSWMIGQFYHPDNQTIRIRTNSISGEMTPCDIIVEQYKSTVEYYITRAKEDLAEKSNTESPHRLN